MPFQRRRKCIFHWGGRAWLAIGDRVKIPRYSRRLMYRKRVTCELHNSYFRLMTIKHAIPKIEWAMELLYNLVKTGSQLVWRPDPLVSRCGRGSLHPAEWVPRPPVEQSRRTRTTHGYVRRGWGGHYVAVLFGLQLPLTHTNLQIK